MKDSLFIGVDIGGTSFRAARFCGHRHTPDAKIKQPTQPVAGRDDMLDRLAAAIRELAGGDLSAVEGIGIAAPGPVDPHAGLVLEAPNIPGWLNLPLQRLMEERLNRPVFLGNDANIAALGEWKFGAGRGHHDVLYMTISTGIGGGVISGDRLILGARGLATEVGHIQIMPNGPRCGCGQLGCLEALASGTAITRIARERLAAGDGADSQILARLHGDLSRLNTVVIGQAALDGDAFARGLIAEAGGHIGYALASFLHLFNPSIVILGGGVSSLGEILFEPVRAAVQRYAMNAHYWRDCPIVTAELGDDAGLIGAGALAMEESRARVMPDR